MNDCQSPDHDYAAFDEEQREWLIRPELELFAILSLGHGIDPLRRGVALTKFRPRYNSLKAAGSKGLKINASLRPELDWGAIVRLEDLLIFLSSAAAGPEYDWLRNFAKRWKSYVGPKGQTKPVRRKRNDPQKESDTRGLFDDVLNMGRELQKKNPKLTLPEIIAKISGAPQFRRYSRETIKQIVYGSYPPMRNRNIIGLLD